MQKIYKQTIVYHPNIDGSYGNMLVFGKKNLHYMKIGCVCIKEN